MLDLDSGKVYLIENIFTFKKYNWYRGIRAELSGASISDIQAVVGVPSLVPGKGF